VEEKKRLNCDEVLDNLRDYLDEQDRADLCREIEEHLKHCHDCQVEVDTIKKTIVLYQADRKTEVPLTVSSALRAALSNMYDDRQR
jgi:predicted anti-sigma-YlaC factor YlaD